MEKTPHFYFTSYNNTMKSLLKKNIDPLTTSVEQEYSFYNRTINKLSQFWAYQNVLNRIQWKYMLKPYCTLIGSKEIPWLLHSLTKIILNYWSYILLFWLVYYDLKYNNYTLHLVFYYLPFYFIYSLWRT